MGNITRKPRLAIVNGQITTTSRLVAETFGKQHKDVLRRISTLDCSQEFHQRNFAPMVYTASVGDGAQVEKPEYRITRDGFMFLTMGFTGKEAASRKETWIDTFNAMAAKLQEKQQKQALAGAKRAQRASKSGASAPPLLGLDPAAAIGAGIPEVPEGLDIPRDLLEAIDARALTLASECLPAFRSYLRRAMVQQSLITPSHKPPHLHPTLATAALAAASLPSALAYEKSRSLTLIKQTAQALAAELSRSAQQIEALQA